MLSLRYLATGDFLKAKEVEGLSALEEHRVGHRLPGLDLRDSRFGIMELGLASGGWGRKEELGWGGGGATCDVAPKGDVGRRWRI